MQQQNKGHHCMCTSIEAHPESARTKQGVFVHTSPHSLACAAAAAACSCTLGSVIGLEHADWQELSLSEDAELRSSEAPY